MHAMATVIPLVQPHPINKRPVLMCAGCQRPTGHVFAEKRLPQFGRGFEFIYACSECQATRIWGKE